MLTRGAVAKGVYRYVDLHSYDQPADEWIDGWIDEDIDK